MLRSKELGGKGWDIGYVRQQLGHEDLKSIEHYISIIRNEERVLREHAAKLQSDELVRNAEKKHQAVSSETKVLRLPQGGVAANGVTFA